MAIISAENKGIQPLTPHQMPLVELGAAAISLERGRYHDIVVASTSYGTNLPEGLQLFSETEDFPGTPAILPTAIDEIPVGHYEIGLTRKSDHEDRRPVKVHSVDIVSTELGRTLQSEFLLKHYMSNPNLVGGVEKLMRAFGYDVLNLPDGSAVATGLPSPLTIVNVADRLGIKVRLFPEVTEEDVKGPEYLKAYSDGMHVISSGSLVNYDHDIKDGHFTSIVLGGDTLRDVLMKVARAALDTGDRNHINNTTARIDAFTTILRPAIAVSAASSLTYTSGRARPLLYEYGDNLGIDREDVDKVIATGMRNAKKFGMELIDLK